MAGKNGCGPVTTTACVFFSGEKLSIMGDRDLPCAATTDDVIAEFDAAVKKLMDGNDFTHLDVPTCFTFDPLTITAATLHQIQLSKICEDSAAIGELQSTLSTFDIGSKNIEIELPECLQAGSAPCATATNTYTLLSLLNLFAAMLCDHETRISNLEP
jgi:hypothetical protein